MPSGACRSQEPINVVISLYAVNDVLLLRRAQSLRYHVLPLILVTGQRMLIVCQVC